MYRDNIVIGIIVGILIFMFYLSTQDTAETRIKCKAKYDLPTEIQACTKGYGK